MRTLIFTLFAASLSACTSPDELATLDTAAEEAEEADTAAEGDALLGAPEGMDLAELLALAQEGAAEEESPAPPPSATDCDLALSYGYAGTTALDQAAGYAYSDYRLGGGGTNSQYAYENLEKGKIQAWYGYWTLSRSSDEAGAYSYWYDASWYAYIGYFYASNSCAAGRAYACSAKSKASTAMSKLSSALTYLDRCMG